MVSNQEMINSFSNTRIPLLLVWERSIREKSHASERRCVTHMTERKEGREGNTGIMERRAMKERQVHERADDNGRKAIAADHVHLRHHNLVAAHAQGNICKLGQ